MNDEILTLEEVASILKCRRSSIYEMSRSRSQARSAYPLKFLKLPFGLRVRQSDLTDYINKLSQRERA